MRQHAALILFIASMMMAAALVGVLTTLQQEQRVDQDRIVVDQPKITGVALWNITDREAPFVRVTITGGGDPVNLSETIITMQAAGGQTDVPVQG